jgi:uncharacterized protein with NAD-binding domain and iron-sulfur cluster
VLFAGSEWGLTAVSQQQFWKGYPLSARSTGEVNGVLSVDISNWHERGGNGRTALECDAGSIAAEVLRQLRTCLPEHADGVLADGNIASWFIDPDIVFFDDATGLPARNDEQLFINQIGTYRLRPNAYTEIQNLFLASDYVRTNTDLATMEGANEAARRAVNAVVRSAGIEADPCRVWTPHEPLSLAPLRWWDRRRFRRGEPWSPHVPRFLRYAAHSLHRAAGRFGR